MSTFPQSRASFVPHGISDHTRCSVQLTEHRQVQASPFRFQNFLIDDVNFLAGIRSSWDTSPPLRHSRSALFLFGQKLKRLKPVLRDLNRHRYNDLPRQSQDAFKNLCNAQEAALRDPSSDNIVAVSAAVTEWQRLSRAEEKFYQQRSHINWLAGGDHNTAFFHNSVRDRKARNTVSRLTSATGETITHPEQIHEEAVRHFSSFLHPTNLTDQGVLPPLADLITYRCSDSVKTHLVSPITAIEIKQVVDQLPANKATGPDGYTAEFFQAAWSVIGRDLVIAVQSFFSYMTMNPGTNATLMALIPKTDNPLTIRDFRPISCCNITYKIISKILANRLKTILPDAIEPNQSASIQGRLLLENVVLATELVKDYHRPSTSARCAIKLDIAKAFDSVRWDFIFHILRTMAIPELYIYWIQECISTASFSIALNGHTGGYFRSNRGLRQGCSFSPYLFSIINNVLSLMLNRAASHGTIGYHPYCSDLSLTHLSFADDIMIFTDGSKHSTEGVMCVLDQYRRISGLSINISKSAIYFGGTPGAESVVTCAQLGLQKEALPIRYLGLPLTTKSLTRDDYEPLIDRIRAHFMSWTTRFLSYAGRLQLIKSVISSITNFWSSVFRLPQRCLNHIEQMCGSFLWSGSISSPARAKVSWEDVSRPKEEGGLGIRKLRDTSLVFAYALIWRLLSSTGSLWVAWTRHYLLRYASFWDPKLRNRGSWIWRKLLKLRPTISPFIRYTIQNGRSTYFWMDNWLGDGPLIERLDEQAIRALGIRREAKVCDAAGSQGWRFRNNRHRIYQEVIEEIRRTPPPELSDEPDSVHWRRADHSLSPSFSSMSVWDQIRDHRPRTAWYSIVWLPYVIPRYAFITWLALLDRLSTGARMAAWGHTQVCPLCTDPVETRDHLFFACPFSFTLWTSVAGRIIGRTITPDWYYTITSLQRNRRTKVDNALLRLIFQSTIYNIWRERNNRIHGTKTSTTHIIECSIKRTITNRLRSRYTSNAEESLGLLTRWQELMAFT